MKEPISIFILVIFSLTSASMLLSCEKDPETIIETEIVTITDTITQVDTIIQVDTITLIETIIETVVDTATTFILVRHAETAGGGSNPNLSVQGQNRAVELGRILSEVPLDAVFSTNFNRTMQTAEPTATVKGLSTLIYDPFNLNPFVDANISTYKQGILLVVGHSNTTPSLLNVLTGENDYTNIPETEYDNLYVVTVFEKGRSKVIHMKYGE